MSGYGADGTNEQLDRVVNYFQRNLTVVNVNTSPPEDLKETLQISDVTVSAIVAQGPASHSRASMISARFAESTVWSWKSFGPGTVCNSDVPSAARIGEIGLI